MQPQTSKLVTIFLIILIVLAVIYVYFSVRPTKNQVEQYQKPVLAVPTDILSKADSTQINKYDPNQPVPFPNDIKNRDNPFSAY